MSEHQPFEAMKQFDDAGVEYWSARALAPLLEYKEWRNFQKVILKAMVSCEVSEQLVADHFVETNKMVELGSGASRALDDFHLSRYACYLVVQNGDPAKPVIAAGQTYFAIQTRRQELADDAAFKSLREDEKRLFLRKELKEHNKHLVETAQLAGVETTFDFAIFQNHGYKGLYGGLDQRAIHERKGLKKSQKILDHMGLQSLRQICFGQRRRKTNCAETLLTPNNKLIRLITKLDVKFVRLFMIWVARCQKRCHCQKKAFSNYKLA